MMVTDIYTIHHRQEISEAQMPSLCIEILIV